MKRGVYLILCLEGAVLSFSVAATAALIPSIAQEFALSQLFVGKIVWLYMLPYGVAALAYGPLVRAFCAKKIELICFFLFTLANFMAALAKDIQLLFAARFLMGVFGASVIPLILILIARHTPSEKRGRAIGVFFSSTFVASLLGLFLSGIVNWRLIYLIPAIAGLILWLVMYLYLPSFKEDQRIFKFNYLAAFKEKHVLSVFIYIFCISLIYHGIQQWLGVYFSTQFNFSQFLISMLVTLTSLSGIFGEVLGGRFADSLGRVRTIDLGIALMIFSSLALIFKAPLVVLALLMVIWGLGWTFNHAGLSTMLTDLPKEFLNEAASLNSSVRFISGGLGALLGQALIQKGFVFSFLTFGISLLVLLIFARNLLTSE